MNWQHLTYFQKVAECGVITKAAEDLYITPSALSRAIASLEEELGVALFIKKGRNITLNRYGRVFYEYISNATSEVNTGIAKVRSLSHILTGHVRISSIFSVGTNYIPDLLADFCNTPINKDIKIELSQSTTAQILQDISNDKLDIGFCGEFDDVRQYPDINREPIYDEKVMLIVPENHPLASKETATFQDIQDETFIGYNNSTGIVTTIYNAVERAGHQGFRFNTILESNEDNNTTNLVRKGLGIAFVVDNPSIYTGGVKVLKITDLHFFRTIYMVWRRDTYASPVVNKFKEAVFVHKNKYFEKRLRESHN